MTQAEKQRIEDSLARTKLRKQLIDLERWLDARDLARLEDDRDLAMEGYGHAPKPLRYDRSNASKRPRWAG